MDADGALDGQVELTYPPDGRLSADGWSHRDALHHEREWPYAVRVSRVWWEAVGGQQLHDGYASSLQEAGWDLLAESPEPVYHDHPRGCVLAWTLKVETPQPPFAWLRPSPVPDEQVHLHISESHRHLDRDGDRVYVPELTMSVRRFTLTCDESDCPPRELDDDLHPIETDVDGTTSG